MAWVEKSDCWKRHLRIDGTEQIKRQSKGIQIFWVVSISLNYCAVTFVSLNEESHHIMLNVIAPLKWQYCAKIINAVTGKTILKTTPMQNFRK
jgi:hypothetical protein